MHNVIELLRHFYGYDANGQERKGGGSTLDVTFNAEGLVTQTTESTSGTGPYTDTFGYSPDDLLSSVTMGDPCSRTSRTTKATA